MSKTCETGCVSRRTILLRAAGALPLIALGATGAHAGKLSQASEPVRVVRNLRLWR